MSDTPIDLSAYRDNDGPVDFTRHIFFTTLRLETADKIGTGFLYQPDSASSHRIYLITNKHVVEDGESVTLHMLSAFGDSPLYGEPIEFSAHRDRHEWIHHSSPDVDVAALPFEPVLAELAGVGKAPYFTTVGDWHPGNEDIGDYLWTEEVTFVGYPNGLYDDISLTPIVRRGISATPFQRNWRGSPAFLIDAYVIPGSSGSPVFVIHNGIFQNGPAVSPGTRLAFLGILGKGIGEDGVGDINVYHNLGIVYNWTTINDVVSLAERGGH